MRRRNAIESRRIDGTRRAVTTPRASSQLVELLPITFLPSSHGYVRVLNRLIILIVGNCPEP